ncbi:hypothetical protein ACWEBX_40230, partial [Streptomyces sp. NPDC005070]
MNAAVPADGAADRLTGLVGALRSHGVRIGTGETVDAAQAVAALGFASISLNVVKVDGSFTQGKAKSSTSNSQGGPGG